MLQRINKYKIIGTFIIIIGLLFNEYTIKIISGYETKFETVEKSIVIILCQILLIVIGIYIFKKKKDALQNIALTVISIAILFAIIEIVLKIFYNGDIKADEIIWIPAKYVKENNRLFKQQIEKNKNNEYGFNDIKHSFEKPRGIDKRIAILGDSFIWGVGVDDTIIWTNKLKQEFKKNDKKIEVLNWGRDGWATIDEFNFLKNEGIKYKIDLVIFTFVINDPVMNGKNHEELINKNGFIDRILINTIGIIYPNSIELLKGLLNNFFQKYFNYGYQNWLENKIYAKDNLKKYHELINEIKYFCEKEKLRFIFVLTPENHNELFKKYLKPIKQILNKCSIEYLDLYYYVKKDLGKYSIRELWANPADSHPNGLVTNVYAKYVYEYLIKTKLIP